MAAPKQKFFGNLLTDELREAFKIDALKTEYNGKPQLKIGAAMWEDGNITIDVWDADNKKSIKIGQLRVSTLNQGGGSPNQFKAPEAPTGADSDLPF